MTTTLFGGHVSSRLWKALKLLLLFLWANIFGSSTYEPICAKFVTHTNNVAKHTA